MLILMRTAVEAIIGYDCGSNQINLTRLSLLEVGGECDIPEPKLHAETTYIQLLQIIDFTPTQVRKCKKNIRRTISHCGMHSHISAVTNGQSKYIHELSHQQCDTLHSSGKIFSGQNLQISNLKVNQTSYHSVLLAGFLAVNGNCSGTQYSDPFGTWNNAIVQAVIKVTLEEYYTSVNLNTNKIHLRSGITYSLFESHRVDMEGQTFWNPLPDDVCNFNKYEILYKGFASKTNDNSTQNIDILYSHTTQDINFVPTLKAKNPVSNLLMITTEHPKLLILEVTPGTSIL